MRSWALYCGAVGVAAGLALVGFWFHAIYVGNRWVAMDYYPERQLARLALSAVVAVLLLCMGVWLLRFHFRRQA